jgi:TatA/E family protein of Tat protein translocase
MFGIGFQEMLIILVVVLIFFGPKRLPDLAKSIGKGIAEFKKASEEVRKGIEEAVKEEPVGEGRNPPDTPATAAGGTEPVPQPQESAVPPSAATEAAPPERGAQADAAPDAVPERATDPAATPRRASG